MPQRVAVCVLDRVAPATLAEAMSKVVVDQRVQPILQHLRWMVGATGERVRRPCQRLPLGDGLDRTDLDHDLQFAGRRAHVRPAGRHEPAQTGHIDHLRGATSATSRARASAAFELRSAIPRKTVKQGPTNSVLLATSPLLHRAGGRYFDCNAAYALDSEAAARLWQVSLDTLGN